jgi:hypothetical protein
MLRRSSRFDKVEPGKRTVYTLPGSTVDARGLFARGSIDGRGSTNARTQTDRLQSLGAYDRATDERCPTCWKEAFMLYECFCATKVARLICWLA